MRRNIHPDEIFGLNKRYCFDDAIRFLDASKGTSGKILSSYGLRRTGKTDLMKQLALKYGIPYIYEVTPNDTMEIHMEEVCMLVTV